MGNGARPPPQLADSGAVGHGSVRLQQEDVRVGHHGSQDQHFGRVIRHTAGREAENRRHLAADEQLWRIPFRELGTRLFDARIAEIDVELQRRLPGRRMTSSGDDSSHSEIEVLEILKGRHG